MLPSASDSTEQQAPETACWPQAAGWEPNFEGGGACSAGMQAVCSAYCQPASGPQLPLYAAAPLTHSTDPIQASSVIYICDPRTEEECLQRSLLGLPSSQTQIVRGIVPEASLLFLFNVRTRLLFGVFRAASWPQLNLEPTAWGEETGASRYPLQVRVRLESDAVMQLHEDRFRTLLNYHGSFNRFDLRLSKAQASALVSLFRQFGQPRGHGPAMTWPGADFAPGRARAEDNENWQQQHLSRARNGLIFICDTSTEEECLARRLLGLPKTQISLLSKLSETSLLFLFNVRTRQMLGVLMPDGPAGVDLQPQAWGGGRFPVQVRFRPAQLSEQVLSLPEAALGEVLRYRSTSTRFDLLLRGRALERLVALFAQHGMPIAGSATPLMQLPMMPPMQAQPVTYSPPQSWLQTAEHADVGSTAPLPMFSPCAQADVGGLDARLQGPVQPCAQSALTAGSTPSQTPPNQTPSSSQLSSPLQQSRLPGLDHTEQLNSVLSALTLAPPNE